MTTQTKSDTEHALSKQDLVDLLNEDLALEFRSLVQYVHHIARIKGPEYQQTLTELSHHLNQELEHALTLAKQIDFLGGVPTTQVTTVPPQSDPMAALQDDLALEEAQLKRYRERVEQANESGLPDVAEVLSPLLAQTQDHIRDLRSALGS